MEDNTSRPGSAAIHPVLIDWETGRHDIEEEETRLLLKRFLDFTREQAAEENDLEAECLQLEMEQCGLWYQALGADHSSNKGRTTICEPEREVEEENQVGASHSPIGTESETTFKSGLADDNRVMDDDEFDDVWISNDTTCPYQSGWPYPESYLYGEPKGCGICYPVLETRDLFRIVSDEGVWFMYNDSEQYVMHVKIAFNASEEVAPGPKTKVTLHQPKPSETLYEVTVLPEETEIILYGEVMSFTNLTERVKVTKTFVNKHVQKMDSERREELAQLVKAAPSSSSGKGGSEMKKSVTPQQILEVCKKSNQSFVDPEFPPCAASLWRGEEEKVFLGAIPWHRPEGYLSPKDVEEVRLFRGEVTRLDPSEGEDSATEYFCSAASILTGDPKLVRALFRHRVSSEEGKEERQRHAFCVSINFNGWWCSTLLDDYLPSSKNGPAFGRCKHDLRKVWYPLLEKCFAKMAGSYAAIQDQNGNTLEALQMLVGCPISSFNKEWTALMSQGRLQVDASKSEELFRHVEKCVLEKQIVCLHSPSSGASTWRGLSIGLKFGGSCEVSQVVRHEHYRMIQVHSSTLVPLSWDGRWCPESIMWKQESEVAAKCSATHGNYNAIWLEWSEALDLFAGGGVCHTRPLLYPNCRDYRVQGRFREGFPSVCLKVEVTESVEVYFLLIQRKPFTRKDPPVAPIALLAGTPAPSSTPRNSHSELDIKKGIEKPASSITPLLCSTQDPDGPMPVLKGKKISTYSSTTSVAMRVLLEPSCVPYYIIPATAATDPKLDVPYTLALVPLSFYSSTAFNASLTDIGANAYKSAVAGNTFNVSGSRSVKAPFQHRNFSTGMLKEDTVSFFTP